MLKVKGGLGLFSVSSQRCAFQAERLTSVRAQMHYENVCRVDRREEVWHSGQGHDLEGIYRPMKAICCMKKKKNQNCGILRANDHIESE